MRTQTVRADDGRRAHRDDRVRVLPLRRAHELYEARLSTSVPLGASSAAARRSAALYKTFRRLPAMPMILAMVSISISYVGTLAKRTLRPSAIVGCVRMASRRAGVRKPRQHRRLHDGDHLARLGAEHREAEDAVAARVDERLHEAARLADGRGRAAPRSWAASRPARRSLGARPRFRRGRPAPARGR